MALYKSLAELRQASLIRADMLGAYGTAARITPSELNDYINASAAEFYDYVEGSWEDYFGLSNVVASVPVPANGSFASLALPFDARYLHGVDVQLGGQFITIDKAPWAERNRLAFFPVAWNFYGVPNVRYCLQGNTVYFFPPSVGAQTVRLWYVPPPPILVDSAPAAWAATHAYSFGDLIAATIAGVSYVFVCVVAGTSDAGAPTWAAQPGTIAEAGSGPTWSFAGLASQFQTYLDSISRWDEFVVVDAAVKMRVKDERDIAELMAIRSDLVARIRRSASIRNASDPQKIGDITKKNLWPVASDEWDQ